MIKYVIRKTTNPADTTSVTYRPQKAEGSAVTLAQGDVQNATDD